MPSIDVSQYVDLTLFDLNSQDIYLKALEYARIALPEWAPVDGAIETVLLQAMAIEVQELATSINRLPGGIVETLLGLMGSKRRDGTIATGEVRIDGTSQSDRTVSSGIRLYYSSTDVDSALTLVTTKAATLTSARPLYSLERDVSGVGIAIGVENLNLTDANIGDTLTIYTEVGAVDSLNGGWVITSIPADNEVHFTSAGIEIAPVVVEGSASLLTVPDSVAPFAYVPVSAILTGYNFIAQNTVLQVMSSVREIAAVTLSTDFDGGSDPETEANYFVRASSALSRMTSALVTATQITQYVAGEYPTAYRVNAVDTCGVGRVINTPGSVYIVTAPIGATKENVLSSTTRGVIAADVSSKSHAALDVNVDAALVLEVGVVASVAGADNVTDQIVEETCTAALSAYLNPDSWDWSQSLRYNELISVVRSALYNDKPAVKYVTNVAITVTGSNIDELSDPGWNLAASGSRATNVLNVAASGSSLSAGDLVAISIDTAPSSIYSVVTAISANEFTVADVGTNEGGLSVRWVKIGTPDIGGTEDITFSDISPLLMSGIHQVNVT